MAAEYALALSGLITVTGPDPKLAKATPRAFYLASDGHTTMSASGLCLGSLFLCPASAVLPFLQEVAREALLQAPQRSLVPGTRIEMRREEEMYQGELAGFLEVIGEAVARLEQLAEGAPAPARGAPLLAAGSPFGALSPRHFAGSVTAGIVSNVVAAEQGSEAVVLLADLRCLPGLKCRW
ncbi:hypothetical protein WJX81_006059 [Elliptochloris bilobata]|uniref:Uncharacterized protein n=1 Tax=Elliptochloris bilobata TaxID=381761 RepID=A0AAW1QDD2_9CHLO